MKFTLSWLKDHLETDADLRTITDALTMIGLELEDLHDPRDLLGAFTIASVIEAKQHPNGDRLKVCLVDTGTGDPVQVVCGAPNARTGMRGVFAPPGTHIPGTGIDLKPGVIRGVESNGMLCSERELMLSEDHDGIIDLADDAPVGTPYADWAGLDDPVIEIGITPNRGDALGVFGVARDLAAADVGKLKDKPIAQIPGAFPCPVKVTLELDAATQKNCPAFGLRMVRGVKNGPSPQWMQKRLTEIGLRPINALVDITNYITFDRGRPLHVFDADKVHGDLTVRMATQGETIIGLDGRDYSFDETMTVIADKNGPEAIAGVMGGELTGCTEETTDVLIESALWDPINVARTGRKLGINTDARYRFERGVDPAFMVPGLEFATKMVLDLCGGEPSEIFVAGNVPEPKLILDFDPAEVKRLAGIDVRFAEIKHILSGLGFWIAGNEAPYRVAVPTYRPDIHGPADLVEEIVRVVGVDRIPTTPFPRLSAVPKRVLTTGQVRDRTAKRALAARGLTEAVTWSFVSSAEAEVFGGGQPELKVANPISVEMSDMRPSLLPGLLSAAQRNQARGFSDLALFEVGQTFKGDGANDQGRMSAGVRTGDAKPGASGRNWAGYSGAVDVFDAKSDALAALAALGAPIDNLQVTADAPNWYHPGRSGVWRLGPKILATFGDIHPRVLAQMDVSDPAVGFEIDLDAIPVPKGKGTATKKALVVSDLMPVRRDFAFVVDTSVEAQKLLRAAKGADKALISAVQLFDVYEGEHVDPGKKSLAIEVTLQPTAKTLTDEEIDAVSAKVVAQVQKATGGELRG
ncbi:MAG: phenylalanine--tRNA ligase subunit beta [Pseudomonadota bacterium]